MGRRDIVRTFEINKRARNTGARARRQKWTKITRRQRGSGRTRAPFRDGRPCILRRRKSEIRLISQSHTRRLLRRRNYDYYLGCYASVVTLRSSFPLNGQALCLSRIYAGRAKWFVNRLPGYLTEAFREAFTCIVGICESELRITCVN